MKALVIELVKEFITAFDASHDPDLWANLMIEEANELLRAETPSEVLKEACDFIYVCAGYVNVEQADDQSTFTAAQERIIDDATDRLIRVCQTYGEDVLEEAFKRVHASNMSKLVDGKPIRRDDGKIMKGPNYKPPVLDDLFPKFN